MLNSVLIVASLIMIAVGTLWLRLIKSVQDKAAIAAGSDDVTETDADIKQAKRDKRNRIIASLTAAIGSLLLLSRLVDMAFGASGEDLHITISPERVDIFGIDVGITIVYSWVAMAVLIAAAAIIRLTVYRNPKQIPTGVQNVVETIAETVAKYTKAQAHGTGELLASYILSIGSFLVVCAMLELFRLRAPTSDISVTFALAFMTFVIINVYGIKRKGVVGRIKSLASPTPLVFPFRLISEFAIPISLACRLFGNMLGGLIVVDLIYNALGNYATGIPGVLGLYFNAFHPLIQTFIFVTLTLTFINEAIENVS